MSEYNDALQRAQRLSIAREALLDATKNVALFMAIDNSDIDIYLRWLISHFALLRPYNQFIKFIEWYPYMYEEKKDETQRNEMTESYRKFNIPKASDNMHNSMVSVQNTESLGKFF
jgi:hypothetical protein